MPEYDAKKLKVDLTFVKLCLFNPRYFALYADLVTIGKMLEFVRYM